MFCITLINIIGVRQSIRFGNVFTVSKLVPLVVFVAVGLFFISPARFTFAESPGLGSFSGAVFILVYLFSGFEAVLVNSGEIRQPSQVIPFALIVALSASVLLFLLIQIVCLGTLPDLATSERPLADASHVFLGRLGPAILSAGALVSIIGTLNVIMLACTRLPFAMAMQGQLPSILARVHQRFRTPHASIIVSAAVVLLLSLTGTFIYALKFTVITRIIVYASTCLALPILRRRARSAAPDQTGGVSFEAPASFEARPSFKAPGGTLISVVCVILCLWLLASSGWREARDVAIAMVIGLLIYAATRLGGRRTTRESMRTPDS